jgi:hypothetical protein
MVVNILIVIWMLVIIWDICQRRKKRKKEIVLATVRDQLREIKLYFKYMETLDRRNENDEIEILKGIEKTLDAISME